MGKKDRAPEHCAPVELTEEQVRAARAGKGTHDLPDRRRKRQESAEDKPKGKKSKH